MYAPTTIIDRKSMNRVLRLHDHQADRYWRIETLGGDLMTNWGKVATSGRYEVKSFADVATCEERALQLIETKLKAGFEDYLDFDPTHSFYYDDDAIGLHPLTSHPAFRHYFPTEVYYSSIQDAAPFGNDEGSDALWELSDLLRRRPKADLTHYPINILSKLYHLPFHPPKGETIEELDALRGEELEGRPLLDQLRRTDRVIIALALAQIKITGTLAHGLYTLALQALDRLGKLKQLGASVRCSIELLSQERNDLETFAHEVGLQ